MWSEICRRSLETLIFFKFCKHHYSVPQKIIWMALKGTEIFMVAQISVKNIWVVIGPLDVARRVLWIRVCPFVLPCVCLDVSLRLAKMLLANQIAGFLNWLYLQNTKMKKPDEKPEEKTWSWLKNIGWTWSKMDVATLVLEH